MTYSVPWNFSSCWFQFGCRCQASPTNTEYWVPLPPAPNHHPTISLEPPNLYSAALRKQALSETIPRSGAVRCSAIVIPKADSHPSSQPAMPPPRSWCSGPHLRRLTPEADFTSAQMEQAFQSPVHPSTPQRRQDHRPSIEAGDVRGCLPAARPPQVRFPFMPLEVPFLCGCWCRPWVQK